jgi:uncharacterized protein (DUF433 family)
MENLLDRISINPDIMMGKPCIKGSRITVEHVLSELSSGMSIEQFLSHYPHINDGDVRAAMAYAVTALSKEDVFASAAE